MSQCGIYMIRNKSNGKIYIGSSIDCSRRFSEHIGRLKRGVHVNAKLQSAWNKYGNELFEFEVLFNVLNRVDLEKIEQHFLDEYMAVISGYNLSPTAGNTFGWKASLETRKKMSEAAKKRDHSIQVSAMARATAGKRRPQYVIDAMQEGRKNKPLNKESKAKMSASAVSRSRYSDSDRAAMVKFKSEGKTLREIGRLFGVPHQCVHSYIKRWINDHP